MNGLIGMSKICKTCNHMIYFLPYLTVIFSVQKKVQRVETINKHHLTGTNIESSFGKEKEVANTYIDYCMLMRPWL